MKPWQMFLMEPKDLDKADRERLIIRAGVTHISWHDTEEEAKNAAKMALRKLKRVGGTGWVACYVEPAVDGPLGSNLNADAITRRIRVEDVGA